MRLSTSMYFHENMTNSTCIDCWLVTSCYANSRSWLVTKCERLSIQIPTCTFSFDRKWTAVLWWTRPTTCLDSRTSSASTWGTSPVPWDADEHCSVCRKTRLKFHWPEKGSSLDLQCSMELTHQTERYVTKFHSWLHCNGNAKMSSRLHIYMLLSVWLRVTTQALTRHRPKYTSTSKLQKICGHKERNQLELHRTCTHFTL